MPREVKGYSLDLGENLLMVPGGVGQGSLGHINGKPTLWVTSRTDRPSEEVKIALYHTGDRIDDRCEEYVGTVNCGQNVYHAFRME